MAHVIFESSNLKSTDIGNIWDVIVNSTGVTDGTAEDCDNGVCVKVGEYIIGEGLQLRYAKKATDGDVVAVLGTPALVKDATTKGQADPQNFTNVAGKPAKAYELVEGDIFAVSLDAFEVPSAAIAGAMVKIGTTKPYAIGEGKAFQGKIHSVSVGDYATMVRILVVKNAPASV